MDNYAAMAAGKIDFTWELWIPCLKLETVIGEKPKER